MKASWITAIVIGVAALGMVAGQASASLCTVYTVLQNGESATTTSASNVWTFNVYGTVTNLTSSTDANGIELLQGSFFSSAYNVGVGGGLLGNLTFTPNSSFASGVGAQAGVSQKFSINPSTYAGISSIVTDVGDPVASTVYSATGADPNWVCLSASPGYVATPVSGTIALGTLTFTLDANLGPASGESATINWVFRDDGATATQKKDDYFVDNFTLSPEGNNTTELTTNGGVEVFFAPEPATMALLAVGAMGLVIRRRRKAA